MHHEKLALITACLLLTVGAFALTTSRDHPTVRLTDNKSRNGKLRVCRFLYKTIDHSALFSRPPEAIPTSHTLFRFMQLSNLPPKRSTYPQISIFSSPVYDTRIFLLYICSQKIRMLQCSP